MFRGHRQYNVRHWDASMSSQNPYGLYRLDDGSLPSRTGSCMSVDRWGFSCRPNMSPVGRNLPYQNLCQLEHPASIILFAEALAFPFQTSGTLILMQQPSEPGAV